VVVTCSAQEQCTFTCQPGYADCDGNPANGCEVNTTDDANNCGACGHGCGVPDGEGTLPSTCNLSMCAAVDVVQLPTPNLTAAPMIVDNGSIVVVDGNTIYGLWKHTPCGAGAPCYPTTLASTPDTGDVVGGLAADASAYYVTVFAPSGTTGGNVYSYPKAGGAAGAHDTYSNWFGLALGGTAVYATSYTGKVDEDPLTSGTTVSGQQCNTQGCRFQYAFGIAADANGAFFAASGRNAGAGAILSFSPGVSIATTLPQAAPTSVLAMAGEPWDVALDAANVYWADSALGTDHQRVMWAPRTGGTATALTPAQGVIYKIAVAGGYVYWTAGSTVSRAKVGGNGAVETLASGETQPWGIAVDGNHVYWTTLAGVVRGVTVWQ
jgi:hypothetical protein